jgi:drug/metabolite transporter (DMT)-like permease
MNNALKPRKAAGTSVPDRLTLLAYGLSILFAGANAVGVRFTVAELPPFWGATIRFGLSALIFWLLAFVRKVSIPKGRSLVGVLLYGSLAFGVSYAFLYWGLQTIPAGVTQVLLALVPLLTFFFAYFHGLESFRWRGLLGALLAVAGIAYAFFDQPSGSLPILSMLAIIAGAACIAESAVLVKIYPPSDPFITNAIAMTVGTLILVVLSVVAGEAWRLPTQTATWVSIIYLVLFGSVLVFYLFLFVIRRWTASATSYQFVLFPFVTVIIAGWLAGETVNQAFLIGGALVLVGVWIGAFSNSSSFGGS